LQNLNFEFLNSLEVLGHPGQNIDTLDMKFHQPLWVSGYVGQSFELIVMGSNPDSKISGGKGGRPQELTGGWMRVHMKRWGRLSGLCGLLLVALSCNLSQRKKQFVFGILLAPAS
jgi:hypothetical protein